MRVLPSLLTIAAALIAMPAAAHIVFADPHAGAGSYYAGFLRVAHGCGTSGTVSVRVTIPEAIAGARPQPKPGWTLAIERTPLATPVHGEGGPVTDRVSAISWTGSLPADQFDQFGIMMKLPDAAGPLYFPTEQRCTTGSNDWIAIPAAPDQWHDTPSPAPMLMVMVKPAAEHHAH